MKHLLLLLTFLSSSVLLFGQRSFFVKQIQLGDGDSVLFAQQEKLAMEYLQQRQLPLLLDFADRLLYYSNTETPFAESSESLQKYFLSEKPNYYRYNLYQLLLDREWNRFYREKALQDKRMRDWLFEQMLATVDALCDVLPRDFRQGIIAEVSSWDTLLRQVSMNQYLHLQGENPQLDRYVSLRGDTLSFDAEEKLSAFHLLTMIYRYGLSREELLEKLDQLRVSLFINTQSQSRMPDVAFCLQINGELEYCATHEGSYLHSLADTSGRRLRFFKDFNLTCASTYAHSYILSFYDQWHSDKILLEGIQAVRRVIRTHDGRKLEAELDMLYVR